MQNKFLISSEAMSVSEIDALRERVATARTQMDRLPATGPGIVGAPDPQTGERWNGSNVLGHLAEALAFWTSQARAVLAGATETGRGKPGYARRRKGIDAGTFLSEPELRSRTAAAVDGVMDLLSGMEDSDLDREILYRARSGERKMRLKDFVEELLVAHLEQHMRQLSELSSGG